MEFHKYQQMRRKRKREGLIGTRVIKLLMIIQLHKRFTKRREELTGIKEIKLILTMLSNQKKTLKEKNLPTRSKLKQKKD